jgi:hypothetical protein
MLCARRDETLRRRSVLRIYTNILTLEHVYSALSRRSIREIFAQSDLEFILTTVCAVSLPDGSPLPRWHASRRISPPLTLLVKRRASLRVEWFAYVGESARWPKGWEHGTEAIA